MRLTHTTNLPDGGRLVETIIAPDDMSVPGHYIAEREGIEILPGLPMFTAADLDDEPEAIPNDWETCCTVDGYGDLCGDKATHYGIGNKPFCEIHCYEDESVDGDEGGLE